MSNIDVPAWAWALLALVLVISLSIDLLAHRGDHVDSRRRAIMWTVLWIALALGFNVFVWLSFGRAAGEEFLAAYLLEKSLSVDNLFVFLLVFGALRIPQIEQRRVLTWGILGAVVFRGLLIFAGAAAVARWHALLYVFGGILIIAAVKLLREPDPEDKESAILTWVRRHLRSTPRLHGHKFFAIENGRRVATPLFLALISIELTDIMFAIDSVPAAFAVTKEPFIIYSSNLLAILGLRALYIVLASALLELRYLRFGLAAVLLLAGVKLIVSTWVKIPPLISIGAIALCIGGSVIASIIANRREARAAREAAATRLQEAPASPQDPQVSETTSTDSEPRSA